MGGGGEGGGAVGAMEKSEKVARAFATVPRFSSGQAWSSQSAKPGLPHSETASVMPVRNSRAVMADEEAGK